MGELAGVARKGGNWMTALGVIAMGLGVLALLAPLETGISLVFLLGGLVTAGGALRMVWAFRAGSFGRGLWLFVIGTLTLLCGLAMLANPLFGSGVLTILLAIYFLCDGVAEIAAGTGRMGEGGGWLVFSGIVSIALGALIWMQYPLSGALAMAILLGIKLLFVGLTMLTAGAAVRAIASRA
jgi:uncharacterized membrane protein HdeD (DUF308 family)